MPVINECSLVFIGLQFDNNGNNAYYWHGAFGANKKLTLFNQPSLIFIFKNFTVTGMNELIHQLKKCFSGTEGISLKDMRIWTLGEQ